MEAVEAMTRRALDLLGSTRNDAYEAALAALPEETREWWADTLASATRGSLRSSVEGTVTVTLAWYGRTV